jgi:pyruvate,orthophosphate dikinase
MFREGDRLAIVRSAILVAAEAMRAKAHRDAGQTLSAAESTAIDTFDGAMARLETLQREDFEAIFRAMDGLPVVIRLIDPPLHEFLPKLDEQLEKVVRADHAGGASAEDRALLAAIEALREPNPMLGLRGCRLGLMVPDFVKMQTRAILNAEVAVKKTGGHPIAKIMIPLVGHVNELKRTRELLEAEAQAVERQTGIDVLYQFGTMIEVPRGALTADEIAQEADFFSFGTNDLTQMTFGYCRDAAERGFLLKYIDDRILPANPFQTLDDAVVSLMATAIDKGRSTNAALEFGICGEHGGDPASIEKCERLGLDYVSCSPFRVPIARLAAARASSVKARGAGS